MSSITSVANNDVLNQYTVDKPDNTANSELGRNEFMELMLAQLNNQSPLEPQDNGEFIAQLAQFSSLEEMQGVASSVDSLTTQFQSSQALQASAMVGRSVLVNASSGPMMPDGSMSGAIDLPASTSSLRINVMNQSGELVTQLDLGQQFTGQVAFHWDGTNSDGQPMPPGQYTISAEASYDSGTEQLETMLSSNVDSVSLGQGGSITLNIAGVGSVPLSEVKEIN